VYVLWPLVFTAFIAVILSMEMLRTLLGVMTAAGIAHVITHNFNIPA